MANPQKFGLFNSLRILKLSNNYIREIPPIMTQFRQLQELDLSYNKLQNIDILFVKYSLLHNLLGLHLQNNSIPDISKHIINFRQLKVLNLENNAIKLFNPYLGFLELKSFGFAGNPTYLSKNTFIKKGHHFIAQHLRNKLPEDVRDQVKEWRKKEEGRCFQNEEASEPKCY